MPGQHRSPPSNSGCPPPSSAPLTLTRPRDRGDHPRHSTHPSCSESPASTRTSASRYGSCPARRPSASRPASRRRQEPTVAELRTVLAAIRHHAHHHRQHRRSSTKGRAVHRPGRSRLARCSGLWIASAANTHVRPRWRRRVRRAAEVPGRIERPVRDEQKSGHGVTDLQIRIVADPLRRWARIRAEPTRGRYALTADLPVHDRIRAAFTELALDL